jgi:hypothetical protein
MNNTKNRRKTVMKRAIVLAISVILTLVVAAPVASAQQTVKGANQSGQIAELSAAWWQQTLNESSPPECGSLDKGAVSGNVFYLANFTGEVNATCTAPTGSRILFPIINYACSPQLFDPYTTEQDLRDECNRALDFSLEGATGVFATVDGEDVTGQIVCADSPLFSLTIPQNGFFGIPGTGPAVADGCWVLLTPLPPGEHTITFGGTFPVSPEFGGGTFIQDATYTVTVVPGNKPAP